MGAGATGAVSRRDDRSGASRVLGTGRTGLGGSRRDDREVDRGDSGMRSAGDSSAEEADAAMGGSAAAGCDRSGSRDVRGVVYDRGTGSHDGGVSRAAEKLQ